MNLTIGDVLAVNHTGAYNIARLKTARFRDVSTDTRRIRKGDLFVALRGDRFDGNRFTAEAFRRGAAAAVVDSTRGLRGAGRNPVVLVPDAAEALGRIAGNYRARFAIPVIAVAGSNGKTTTKDMIAAVLRTKYRVLSTEGNLNNHVGVPLTLFRLRPAHQVAVVEIGTNHFGEVKALSAMTRPTHGLITNIGREHLEFFGGLSGVAKAEGELFEYLRDSGGRAFVNMDDPRIARWSERLRDRVTYGFRPAARGVRGSGLGTERDGTARFTVRARGGKRFLLRTAAPGWQGAANALAAAAVGLEFGVSPAKIRAAVKKFRPAGKRMEMVKKGGVTILNDTYNANPDSVVSALDALGTISVRGKKIVVLADMLEMGPAARREHERIGRLVRSAGNLHLLTFGPMARHLSRSARTGSHFRTKQDLLRALRSLVERGDIVLVKGSRGMRMEEVVESLVGYLGRAA